MYSLKTHLEHLCAKVLILKYFQQQGEAKVYKVETKIFAAAVVWIFAPISSQPSRHPSSYPTPHLGQRVNTADKKV